MSAKVVISGNSFVAGAKWPNWMWDDSSIVDLAKPGASNKFIADSIIDYVLNNEKPNCVFALFGPTTMTDYVLPLNKITQTVTSDLPYYGIVNKNIYFFSGGDSYTSTICNNYANIKDSSWPKVSSLKDFFALDNKIKTACLAQNLLPYNDFSITNIVYQNWLAQFIDTNNLVSQTLQDIFRFVVYMKQLDINYFFSFTHDIFDPTLENIFGPSISYQHPIAKQIDWTRLVKPYPWNFGLKHDLLNQESRHLTVNGEIEYSKLLRNIVK